MPPKPGDPEYEDWVEEQRFRTDVVRDRRRAVPDVRKRTGGLFRIPGQISSFLTKGLLTEIPDPTGPFHPDSRRAKLEAERLRAEEAEGAFDPFDVSQVGGGLSAFVKPAFGPDVPGPLQGTDVFATTALADVTRPGDYSGYEAGDFDPERDMINSNLHAFETLLSLGDEAIRGLHKTEGIWYDQDGEEVSAERAEGADNHANRVELAWDFLKYNKELAIQDARSDDELELAERDSKLTLAEIDRRGEIALAKQTNQQEFDELEADKNRKQEVLDRALAADELTEVKRASLAFEGLEGRRLKLDRERVDLEKLELKLNLLVTLGSAPHLIRFLAGSGLLQAMFGDLGLDFGPLMDGNQQFSFNLQDLSRMSESQRRQVLTDEAAQTGIPVQDILASLQRQAPGGVSGRPTRRAL
jgi:hypothetical protein